MDSSLNKPDQIVETHNFVNTNLDLFENILKELGDVHTENENKTRFVLSIINSCLGDFYYSEGAISPKCVSETKKACLLYLSS